MDMKKRRTLGGLPGAKNVGAKLSTSDLVVGDGLEGGPPLGIEKRLVGQPIRNELLRHRGTLHELREPIRESGLAATGDIDSSLKGANVLLFRRHNDYFYTNQFVDVNNPVCVTARKSTCSVVSMDQARTKRQSKRAPKAEVSSKRVASPGPDGKTLGQRVSEAMAYKSGRIGMAYTPGDLLRDVARIMQVPHPETDQRLQQRLSAVTTNKVSESAVSPAIAHATGVNTLWLCYGWGKMLG